MNKVFKIDGMTCASCSDLIEKEAKKLTGIESISVSYASESAIVNVGPSFDEGQFTNLLDNLGYRVVTNEENSKDNSLQKSIFLLFIGSVCMGLMFLPISFMAYHQWFNLFQLVISFFILVFFGKHYIFNLYRFVRYFYSDMHTLIGIGVISNFLYSLYLYLQNSHAHLYVEAVPFIIGFTTLGQYFEKVAKTKALTSMSALYKMQIKFCKKINSDGTVDNLPVVEVAVGDVIRILPGEKIPVNGIVLKGQSHIDEAFISGESIPRAVTVNDKVVAGAINLEGTIEIKLESTFYDSTISDIIGKLEIAEKNKSKVEIFVNRIVTFFVPSILLISIITLTAWMATGHSLEIAMKYFIAVLVIACPCALGLASPMAVLIGTRRALAKGIMVNGGEVLELGSKVDTIVFDKTGTLTTGHPDVVDFKLQTSNDLTEENLLKIIGSLTVYSSHPLSLAISKFINEKNIKCLDPDKFKNIPGSGFEGEIFGNKVLIGSKKLLLENKIQVEHIVDNVIGSLVLVAIDGKYVGYFLIKDSPKKEAIELLKKLAEQNIEAWMLTGDNEEVANEVAKEIGIKNIKANVSPTEKTDFILNLKKAGKVVAMVGDGINDSIALKSSDVSIAMSNGSDIAISASMVSLLDGNISVIADFLTLSTQTMKIIKQNLFFSFFYNLLCIPLAAGLFVYIWDLSLDPKWASLSMGLSSTSVIINSMRLKGNSNVW